LWFWKQDYQRERESKKAIVLSGEYSPGWEYSVDREDQLGA
jgi:hypothetical protein